MASHIMAHTARNGVFACAPKLPVIHRFLSGVYVGPVLIDLRLPSPPSGDGHPKPH
jgi:hypothetical protein